MSSELRHVVSRSRRDDDRGRRLSRSARAAQLFPYTIDAIRLLNRGGFKVVVVTSQAGVANGMRDRGVPRRGARRHQPTRGRRRRRDRRVLLLSASPACGGREVPDRLRVPEAEARYDTQRRARPVARSRAIVHGRRPLARHRDGAAAGTKGVLVETGYGKTEASRRPANMAPVPVVANLIEATSWILNNGV